MVPDRVLSQSTQETQYSTFDLELLAMYLSIKHFRHFVEGHSFHILTDHKPLTFALAVRSDCYSSSEADPTSRLHFTVHIRHPPR